MKNQKSNLKSQIFSKECLNVALRMLPQGALRLKNVTSERKKKRQAERSAVVLFSERGTFLASAQVAKAFGHFCSKSVNIILVIIFIIICTTNTTFAQSPSSPTLKVTPIIIPLQLSPGKVVLHKIELENLSTTALPLRAQFSDFEPASEDGGYILEQGNKASLASWITLSEKEFILAPKEKKSITLTIHTPARIPVGGYYSLLFFEPVFPKTASGAQITSRIGILILGDIGIFGKEKQKADILTFSLGGMVQESPSLPLLLRVQNVTLHHLNAKPMLSIEPFFGTPTQYPLEEKYIFPGKVRRWSQTITTNQSIGLYNAVIKVSTGNGEQVIEKTFFIVFPVTKTLILLFIITIGIFTYRKRKQLKKAAGILIGKDDTPEKAAPKTPLSPRSIRKTKQRKKK